MKQIFRIIFNPSYKASLAMIVVQQALVALGTYIMGRFAIDLTNGEFNFALLAILFISASFSGSIMHYLAVWFLTKASKTSVFNYLQKYSLANFNQPSHWRQSQSRNDRHDVMIRTGQDSITQTIHFSIDAVSMLLNVLFNTVSIILITNIQMALAIVLAGVVGVVVIQLYEKGISKKTEEEVQTETVLNSHLAKSWDNLVLGNTVFYSNWQNIFKNLFAANEHAALRTVQVRDKSIAISSFLTTSIVLGVLLYLGLVNKNNVAFLIGLVTMVPRSLQIASYIQILHSYFAQWSSLKQRLIITESTLNRAENIDLDLHIKQEKISVKNEMQKCLTASVFEKVETMTDGRITIEGENGSGKSTFLLKLKQLLDSKAILLPAQHQLVAEGVTDALSSGEKFMQVWEFLKSNTTEILLLDEWDANLSQENATRIDEELKQISKNRLVIEVRHFKGAGC